MNLAIHVGILPVQWNSNVRRLYKYQESQMAVSTDRGLELIQLVEQAYPDWQGYADQRFAKDEIDYKYAAVELLKESLNEGEFKRLLDAGDWDEIKRRLINVSQKSLLLFLGVPKSGDLATLYIDGVDLSLYLPQVFQLLYGPGSSNQRLDAYSQFLEENDLPNKWPFPTMLLFLSDPSSEIIVKPVKAGNFIKFVHSNLKMGSKPSGDKYDQFKELVVQLGDSIKENHPAQDMIHLQSIIWTAMSELNKPKKTDQVKESRPTESADGLEQQGRVWKIAPGRNAHWWDTWVKEGIAAIGWNETGDLNERSDWNEFQEFLNSQDPDSEDFVEKGSRQAWRFAHEIEVGDTIVANKGKEEIIGIGVVTGEYVYSPEAEYGHQRKVNWHDIESKSIERQDGWLKTLVALPKDFLALLSESDPDARLFSNRSFELLSELSESPLKTTYESNKEEIQKEVEKPLQDLLNGVIKNLPDEVLDATETRVRLFSRIPKNDWGQGGAWDFYWGAIYQPGLKRTSSVQLFCLINKEHVRVGFSFSDQGATDQRQRFNRNVEKYLDVLSEVLDEQLSLEGLRFEIDGEFLGDWKEWIQKKEAKNHFDAEFHFESKEAYQFSKSDLVEKTTEIFVRLFPLYLLATEDDPVGQILEFVQGTEDTDVHPNYTLEQIADKTGFPIEQIENWVHAIERKKQAIFYGPPGTGKTFVAGELSNHLLGGGNGTFDLVQFHPAYEYEDFMIGIRPITENETLRYKQVPGRFLEFCREAKKRNGISVLIIDEINRANLSRVFGELMYLLEYRDEEIPLAGGERLQIPEDVRIIGTMNTADRSIALVDHALRRRFAFLELSPNFDALESYHENSNFDVQPLIEVLTDLNKEINDKNYEVGISFFIDDDLENNLPSIWQLEIEPYLEEYFIGQPEKVAKFRWSKIKERLFDE